MGSNSAVGMASRKLIQSQRVLVTLPELLPLQDRKIERIPSIGNKFLQIRFADATNGVDVG